jgi:hypothetical protein
MQSFVKGYRKSNQSFKVIYPLVIEGYQKKVWISLKIPGTYKDLVNYRDQDNVQPRPLLYQPPLLLGEHAFLYFQIHLL